MTPTWCWRRLPSSFSPDSFSLFRRSKTATLTLYWFFASSLKIRNPGWTSL